MPDIFQQHLRHIPTMDPWALVIDGRVEKPLTLTLANLHAMPATTVTCTLACSGHTPQTAVAVDVTWTGVPLEHLLAEAAPLDGTARTVNAYSADGYATGLAMEHLDGAMLAYEMNGEPIPAAHGWPARLVVPGHIGYKLPKWVTMLSVDTEPVLGYWEQRGADTTGLLLPTAQFSDMPAESAGMVQLRGTVYGAMTVQISIDDGPWNTITSVDPSSPVIDTWYATWAPPAPGLYTLRVRAIDENGLVQHTPHTYILRSL